MKRLILFFSIALVTFGVSFLLLDKAGLAKNVQAGTNDKPYMVMLQNNKADPNVLTIKKGEYVQFNSNDGKYHNLTQGLGNRLIKQHDHSIGVDSGKFGPDEAYRVQFKEVGEYDFHDHYYPDIYVTVIVKE